MELSSDDLQALVDGLSNTSGNLIANYSTELLQQAGEKFSMQTVHELLAAVEDAGLAGLGGGGGGGGGSGGAKNALVNSTLELLCQQQQKQEVLTYNEPHAQSSPTTITTNTTSLTCPISFDSVMCWPRTAAGNWAVLPCFAEFKGVHYDTTQNASRYCFPNGTWNNYSNYDKCHHATPAPVPDFALSVEIPAYIYCCGYFLSFTALVLALIVFLYFKDLKCLRNTIHANLFLTYILSALLWILTLFLQVMTDHTNQAGCITLVMFFHYFNLTNFFWMFVEGLYLYTLVVQTFSSEYIRFCIYGFIGWGCPAIIVFVWSLAQVFVAPQQKDYTTGAGARDSLKKLDIECSWMRESQIDWIFQGPAALVLLLNLIFLIRIMWVLITKLRSANTQETRQYLKASKALLVLIPLFGITYLLVLTGPEHGISRNIFEILRAFLISTQGFFVSFFFCFLNSEVRQALRHRFERWRDDRDLRRGNSQRTRRYRLSKDYSHRSRTESLRLTTTGPVSITHLE